METRYTSVQENICRSWYHGHRHICNEGFLSNPYVHVMEAGTIQQELTCILNILKSNLLLCSPLFCYNRKSTVKSSTRPSLHDFTSSSMTDTVMVSRITFHVCKNSPIAPETKYLVKDPTGNYHPLIQWNSVKLVVWIISGKIYREREFQKGLQTLSPTPDKQAQLNITNWLRANGLAGVADW